MPDLSRTWTWAEYTPDLGDNRQQPKPFFFKVKSCLTKDELKALSDRLVALDTSADDFIAKWAEAFKDLVELGDEPLTIQRRPVQNLAQYAAEVVQLSGGHAFLLELQDALMHFNSWQGQRELFYARRSGGTAFTPGPSVVKGSGQAAVQ